MLRVNLLFGWSWVLVGLLSGTLQGLFFHREDWLGGYDSWRRRLTRLGHIAFLGTALLNIGFALSAAQLDLVESRLWLASALLIVGAATMPIVCYLSAWHKPLRRMFFVPVLSLVAGVLLFLWAALVGGRRGLDMKIGLIAMSGVRCCDEELMRLGLTLPGFVERSRTVASLPSLGLLTLAGMTPEHHELAYREVAELDDTNGELEPFDLVAISTFTAQAEEAYELADHYRDAGAMVVIGGLHATSLADEAAEHSDAVVVGEARFAGAMFLTMPNAAR